MMSRKAPMLIVLHLLTFSAVCLGQDQSLGPYDISGSGTIPDLSPFTCANDNVTTLRLEIFDILPNRLAQLLGCAATDSSDELLYTISLSDIQPIKISELSNISIVDDYLDQGTYQATIEVCVLGESGNDSPRLSCDDVHTETQIYSNVTIIVGTDEDLAPFTCTNDNVNILRLEIFDILSTTLAQLLGCAATDSSDELLYTISLSDRQPIKISEPNSTVDDYFDQGSYRATIIVEVCVLGNNSLSCDDMMQTENQTYSDVTIVVGPNTKRLFPYGPGDEIVSDIDDETFSIVSSDGIPFLTDTYNILHISSNGLVSFTRPYRAWWATPIPFGRYPTPIIAPYWSDIDFRNNLPDSGVYYRIYEVEANDRRTVNVLREFNTRLANYAGINFDAEWLMVVTWKDATPYYGRRNTDEVVTFQLVLATDFLTTYAFFLYDDSTWSLSRRFWPRVVIGHDNKDFTNYDNIQLTSPEYLRIQNIQGNTGRTGEWYFNYTAQGEVDSAKICLQWAQRQDRNVSAAFEGVPSCPCTHQQAWRDWSFWFGYYWGFSARPNCATLLFSRRQSTIECCYDDDGSLIVGANDGGSFLLYNPLFRHRQNILEDRQPYRYCCEESKLCQLYYLHRPSDDCSMYVNIRPAWMFGDPHFASVDNNNFTFNGIGEYLLLQSSTNDLTIQSRLVQFENTNASVMSAIAIEQGGIQLQVEVKDGALQLSVQGISQSLPTGDNVYIVTANGINSILNNGLDIQSVTSQDLLIQQDSSDQLSLQVDDSGTLVVITPGGATVMVSLQMSFLQTTMTLSDNYMEETRGLMGVYNGDPSDDFTLPDSTVLSGSLTEAEIYSFGLQWHVDETDSIFHYSDNTSYSTYNLDYLTFMPTFTSELMSSLPSDADSVCQGNQACLYDYAISGNAELGNSTQMAAMSGQDLQAILSNSPPNITGSFLLYVNSGESVNEMYNADDPDEDSISTFILKDGPEQDGITFTMSMTFMDGILRWNSPGLSVPSSPITLFANDSKGASSTRRVSIVLCGCINGGICVQADRKVENIRFDENGHFKQLCSCPQFYGGDSCEIEMRGCDYSVCPDSNVCEADAAEPSGYVCTGCQDGFMIVDSKCIDINECVEMTNNCTQNQLCVNTEGGFICECKPGFRSLDGGATCQDINECAEGVSSCSQVCTNTVGSYTCSCHPGYTLDADGSTCTRSAVGGFVCDEGAYVMMAGEHQCVCPVGQQCMGVCNSSDVTALQNGIQTCQDCTGQQYGYECGETCSCMNGGSCNNTIGCICPSGWTGSTCTIEVNAHAPVFSVVTPVMLNWTALAGLMVARVNASDADTGPNAGSVTYSLVRPEVSPPTGISDGLTIFNISPTTGIITLTSNLIDHIDDFSEILLTIKAQDQGPIPLSATTVLSIVPIPVPYLEFDTRIQVPEDTPENTDLTSVTCAERGRPSNSLSLNLQGNFSRFFAVSLATSQLSLVRKLDFESLTDRSDPFYRLDLVCQNQYGLSVERKIEIEVLNIDDNPFVFSRTFYSASVLENASIGMAVIQITASDADFPSGMITYAFVENDSHFTIGTASGTISIMALLDREEQDFYALMVRAELAGSQIDVPVNISVLDVNDETPVFIDQPYIVNNLTTMNEVGDHVVTVIAQDPDAGVNGQITYSLANNSYFAINESTGVVYVDAPLPPIDPLMLQVTATDGGDPAQMSSTTIHIFVQPSPEGVRFTRTRFNFRVEEDTPRGALIGQVEASVVDGRNVTLNDSRSYPVVYSIVNSSDISIFTIISTTGEIYLLSTLDFDQSARQYLLTIQAFHQVTNELNFTAEATVLIEVSDINDNPPRFFPAAYAIAVEEFTPANSSIVNVSATDIDSDSNITYSVASGDSGPFQIHPYTGVISTTQELLIARDYRFFVTAFDGKLSSMAVVFISVTRSVSVEPTFTRERYIFNLPESATRGSYVGMVEAVTRGSLSSLDFNHLQFRIVMPVDVNVTSQPGDGLFHIDDISGNISTLTDFEFDAENRTTYVFFVQIYSNIDDAVHDTTTVAVELLDANDNSPVFSQSLYTRVIERTAAPGSVILNVSATDRDSTTNSEIRYSIEPLSFDFTINRTSGEISIASSSLEVGNYRLTVIATDKGSPPLNGTTTVIIAVIPAVPSNLVFTQPVYRFGVSEDAEANALVGRVQALDAATNMTLSSVEYSTSNLSICLHVGQDDGEIRVSCDLDRETEPRYELQVFARDRNATGYGTVIVDVLDVNDNSPKFSLDVYAEVIDDQFGNETAILQVNAIDSDAGRNSTITYSFTPTVGAVEDVSSHFRINSSSGAIYLHQSTIAIGDYRLTVQATDSGVPQTMSSTAIVLICVIRARPSVFFFNTSATLFIDENQSPQTTVGSAVLLTTGGIINPMDFMNNLHFSIIGGDSVETTNSSFPLFGIDSDTGRVYTIAPLDREEADRHVIVVLANFTLYGLTEQGSLNIEVIDQNDVRPMFGLAEYVGITEENAENDTVVVNVTIVDEDVGPNAEIELYLINPIGNPFSIRVRQTNYPYTHGEIFVQNSDLLIPGLYNFGVTASDRGINPLTSTSRIYITVEHSPPEFLSFEFNPYIFELTENAMVTSTVGNVSIEQPITPALDTLLYSIVAGNEGGFFGINGSSGVISNQRPINRETNSQFNLTIEARVLSEPSLAPTVTTVVVNIADTNDNVPVFSTGSYSVTYLTSDLTARFSLVDVMVTDADIGSNAAVVLSLEDASSSGDSRNFNITPDGRIFNTTSLNATRYIFNVVARDMGAPPLSSSASVSITIQLPVPDSISFVQPGGYVFNISENVPSGAIVGDVVLAPVPDHVIQFIEFTDNTTDFQLVRNAGEVRVQIQSLNLFDYEARQSYTFRIEARVLNSTVLPPVNLRTSVIVTVIVIDTNDNEPVFVNFPSRLAYLENRTREELVHDFNATDADSGTNSIIEYQIVNQDIQSKFRIDSATGELFVSARVDREERETYRIIIQAMDRGTPRQSVQSTTTITLLDINDNVPRMTNGFSMSVRERVQPPLQLTQFMGVDPDLGSNGTFQFSAVAGGSIPDIIASIVTIHTNGSVELARELDYEQVQTYTIHVRIADQGTPPLQFIYMNITLQVINEPDNTPQFIIPGGAPFYSNTTLPRLRNGDILALVRATDLDPNDIISYEIASITVEGNNGMQPAFRIDSSTGSIYHSGVRGLIPEANFTINVVAYDNSRFNLSVGTQVKITVLPERLQFTQANYTVQLSEDASISSVVSRVPLQPLSASSLVHYLINVDQPAGQTGVFRVDGQGQSEAIIHLARRIDRENIENYTLSITAQRVNESDVTAIVFINVTDVNDNRPQFSDPPDSVIFVLESTTSQVRVSKVNATDADSGENGRLQYRFRTSGRSFPFMIDLNTGDIEVSGDLDYEMTSSYTVTVDVSDSGARPQVQSQVYIIQLINENDNFPVFSSGAYFGEIYAGSSPGDYVLHTRIQVTDRDDPSAEQPITFEITFAEDSSRSDYVFEVESEAPHRIRIVSLPQQDTVTESQLLQLRVTATDVGLSAASARLFISVFTYSNLISFQFSGITFAQLLDCSGLLSSICGFLRALAIETQTHTNTPVTFYNYSIQSSPASPLDVDVVVYGWFGDLEPRNNNGELSENSETPQPVQYVQYDEELFTMIADANIFEPLTFGVEFKPNVEATQTEGPSVEGDGGGIPTVVILGVAVGGGLAVMVIFLIIVLVCVFGRRRGNDKPKKKKRRRGVRRSSDPYDRGLDRHLDKPRPKPKKKSKGRREAERMVLSPSMTTDQAYETMFDDDELLGNKQTMPWFDPNYMASNDNASYDGDIDQQSSLDGKGGGGGGGLGLRATVDGNARRRRHSSDEDESVKELSTAQESHLQSYQESTPMQPGQRMGEFDMFVKNRDSDKPFRPSLPTNWERQQQYLAAANATSRF